MGELNSSVLFNDMYTGIFGLIATLLISMLIGIVGALWGPATWVQFFDDMHWTSGFGLGAALALKAYLQANTSTLRTFFRWVLIGMTLETAGQLIWDVQDWLNWLPFPGPSDVAWVLVGPALCIGVWKVGGQILNKSTWRMVRLDAAIFLIATITASMAIFLPSQGEFTLFQLAVMSAYPVGYIAPFCLIVILLLALRMKLNLASLLLPFALLALGIDWAQWNLLFLQNQQGSGTLFNVSLSVISMVIGIGALRFKPARNIDAAWDRRCEGILRVLPLVMVVLSSIGVVIANSLPGVAYSVKVCVTLGGGIVVVLAAFRQNVLLTERDRLIAVESIVKQREVELETTNQKLEALNRDLEDLVAHRTAQLVQSEKLASLGALVAGVAHEINTPIGNSLLITSTLTEKFQVIIDALNNGKILRSELESNLLQAVEATNLVQRNLERVANLVINFKQIAVDRTGAVRRQFSLHVVVNETLAMHRILWKNKAVEVQSDIPKNIELDNYPGAIGQLLDILLENIVKHAFDGCINGMVTIKAEIRGKDGVEMTIADNGNGIAPENIAKIFDPFFTTRLGQGGSGLGLHIAWNIVNNVLGGSINVSSVQTQGTRFLVSIPLMSNSEHSV